MVDFFEVRDQITAQKQVLRFGFRKPQVAEDVVAARVAITDGAHAASNSPNGNFEIDRL